MDYQITGVDPSGKEGQRVYRASSGKVARVLAKRDGWGALRVRRVDRRYTPRWWASVAMLALSAFLFLTCAANLYSGDLRVVMPNVMMFVWVVLPLLVGGWLLYPGGIIRVGSRPRATRSRR